MVNYDGNYPYGKAPKGLYRKETTDIGSFPPNAFGLYDMHGNVYGWCADDWHDNYKDAPDDGMAWTKNDNHSQDKDLVKVLRGGSWLNLAWLCRSGSRNGSNADFHLNYYGFRVACVSFLPRTR